MGMRHFATAASLLGVVLAGTSWMLLWPLFGDYPSHEDVVQSGFMAGLGAFLLPLPFLVHWREHRSLASGIVTVTVVVVAWAWVAFVILTAEPI